MKPAIYIGAHSLNGLSFGMTGAYYTDTRYFVPDSSPDEGVAVSLDLLYFQE